MKTRRTRRSSASSQSTEGDGDLEDLGRQRVTRRSSNAKAKDSPAPAPAKKPRRSSRLSPGSEQNQPSPASKASTPSPPTTRRTRRSPPSDDGTPTPKSKNSKAKAKTKQTKEAAAANVVDDKRKISEDKDEVVEKSPSPKLSPKNSDAEDTKEAKINDVDDDEGKVQVDSSPSDNANEKTFDPPPVKEVITKKPDKSKPTTRHAKGRSGPKLDEKTLTMITSHLDESKKDVLDEDEVENFTLRMHRAANQQTRLQLVLASAGGRAANKEIYEYADDQQSDAGSNDTSIFADCLAEEEEHAVGHDLMKKLLSKFQPTNASSNKSTGGSKSSMDTKYDKKTLLWVKRAAGLHRSSGDDTSVVPQPANTKSGRMTTRHATRKLVTDRREKKREKGLDILATAVSELEAQYGPFPAHAPRPKKVKRKRGRFDYDSSDDDSMEYRRQGSVEAEVARRLAIKLKRNNSRSSKENEVRVLGSSLHYYYYFCIWMDTILTIMLWSLSLF